MSEPFIGEIRAFGFNFAPRGWAFCNGQLLPIAQNNALFSLLGTIYGGDGRTTLALPDLRGRSMVQFGQGAGLSNIPIGARGGSERVTLTTANLPPHSHSAELHAENEIADKPGPNGKMLAKPNGVNIYMNPRDALTADNQIMAPGSVVIGNTGGGQSFDSRSPYLAVNLCIALTGVFPSRS